MVSLSLCLCYQSKYLFGSFPDHNTVDIREIEIVGTSIGPIVIPTITNDGRATASTLCVPITGRRSFATLHHNRLRSDNRNALQCIESGRLFRAFARIDDCTVGRWGSVLVRIEFGTGSAGVAFSTVGWCRIGIVASQRQHWWLIIIDDCVCWWLLDDAFAAQWFHLP